MIAPNVKWDHSLDWFVTSYRSISFDKSAERKIKVSLTDPDFDFMSGHTIDGKIKTPLVGFYLMKIYFRKVHFPCHRLSLLCLGKSCKSQGLVLF